jgi:hypothetical protein
MTLTEEQVYDLLREKLKSRIPFSLLRYGDGDGVFGFIDELLDSRRRYKGISEKNWGEVPDNTMRQQIITNIQNSYIECDVAGLPYGYDGDTWEFALRQFLRLYPKPKTCIHNIHILIYKSGVFDELIKGRHIFYVSCRNVDDVLIYKGALSVSGIQIPAQYRFEKIKPDVPFFRKVEAIEQQIKKIDFTGMFCLLGTGAAGKHLGNMMRDNGGVVLDTGSVFDLLAGLRTRGWMKETK